MGRHQIGQKKKKPSDYPQFAFRTSKANIERLNATLEEIQGAYIKRKDPEAPYWSKGDIIVEALTLGLKLLKKRGQKRFGQL